MAGGGPQRTMQIKLRICHFSYKYCDSIKGDWSHSGLWHEELPERGKNWWRQVNQKAMAESRWKTIVTWSNCLRKLKELDKIKIYSEGKTKCFDDKFSKKVEWEGDRVTWNLLWNCMELLVSSVEIRNHIQTPVGKEIR